MFSLFRKGQGSTPAAPAPSQAARAAAPRSPESGMTKVSMTVNGKAATAEIDPRTLLVQFLRENLRLTGTHVGCDTSQCGACVVHLDGRAVKSCTVLAASCDGAKVTTIEGLAKDGKLHPDAGGLPPASRPAVRLLYARHDHGGGRHSRSRKGGNLDEHTIREGLEGNLCRCTGYHNIVAAVQRRRRRHGRHAPPGRRIGVPGQRTAVLPAAERRQATDPTIKGGTP